MNSRKPLISIVTPVYNEEDNLHDYYARMTKVLDSLSSEYDFEIVMTDNRSTDRSFAMIRELAHVDPRVRGFRFSRNYGYQRSIFTGYKFARGDAAMEFDCDLQDPPELLPLFLQKWKEGNEVVYGVRTKRAEGFMLNTARKIFYRLLRRLSHIDLPVDAGDFLLIDRKVLDQLASIYDPHIYIRGSIFEMGFRRIGIPYQREPRKKGQSKFPIRRLIELAIDGIVSQSTVPLRIAAWFGVAIAFSTLLVSLGYIVAKIFFRVDMPSGFTTTVVLILFSISVNAIFLGVIGEYLARMYAFLRARPITIIDERVGSSKAEYSAERTDKNL